MVTLSISSKLIRQNEQLVVIPRSEYESLLRVKSHTEEGVKIKSKKLSASLRAGLKDMKEGRVSGPFDSVKKLMRHLGR